MEIKLKIHGIIYSRVNPKLLFFRGTNSKFEKAQKGGDTDDFRYKRKSTNYNFNNHNSAFHRIGFLKGDVSASSALFIL